MSSSPFRSYFPRNGARYHPLSRPFPFSFNPAPDLTPPPDISPSLFPSLSLVLFHFPLHIFIRSSLLTINAHHLHVGSLDQPPLLPRYTLQPFMVPILRVTPSNPRHVGWPGLPGGARFVHPSAAQLQRDKPPPGDPRLSRFICTHRRRRWSTTAFVSKRERRKRRGWHRVQQRPIDRSILLADGKYR